MNGTRPLTDVAATTAIALPDEAGTDEAKVKEFSAVLPPSAKPEELVFGKADRISDPTGLLDVATKPLTNENVSAFAERLRSVGVEVMEVARDAIQRPGVSVEHTEKIELALKGIYRALREHVRGVERLTRANSKKARAEYHSERYSEPRTEYSEDGRTRMEFGAGHQKFNRHDDFGDHFNENTKDLQGLIDLIQQAVHHFELATSTHNRLASANTVPHVSHSSEGGSSSSSRSMRSAAFLVAYGASSGSSASNSQSYSRSAGEVTTIDREALGVLWAAQQRIELIESLDARTGEIPIKEFKTTYTKGIMFGWNLRESEHVKTGTATFDVRPAKLRVGSLTG